MNVHQLGDRFINTRPCIKDIKDEIYQNHFQNLDRVKSINKKDIIRTISKSINIAAQTQRKHWNSFYFKK